MTQKSLKKNTALSAFNTVLGLLFPLITFPYSSRVLGPENIGKVNFSQSIVSYFTLLAGFGIGTYGIREVAKARDDKNELSKIFFEIFLFNMLTTLFAYALFFIVVYSVPKLSAYREMLHILSLLIVFSTIGINWLYVAMEDYGYITARSLFFQFLSLVLLLIFVRERSDYVVYAWLLVLANGGASLLNFIHSRKYISLKNLAGISVFRHFRPLLVFFITAVSATLHTLIDQTMIGFFVDDKSVGLYAVAIKIINMLTALVVSVSAVLLPRLSYLAERDKELLCTLLEKTINILLLLSVPFVFGLFIESGNVILIICGQEYAEAIPLLKILSFLVIVVTFTNLIGNQFFIAINKEKWVLLSAFVGLICNIVLNAICIPKYQATGAAITTVVSELVVLIIQIILFVREMQFKLPFKYFFVILFNAVLMSVVVVFVKRPFQEGVLQFVVSVCCGIVAYMCLLLMERNCYLLELITSVKNMVRSLIFKNGSEGEKHE